MQTGETALERQHGIVVAVVAKSQYTDKRDNNTTTKSD
jgi:hypothetical protein